MSTGRSKTNFGRPVRVCTFALVTLALTLVLALLPGRGRIPPLIESDYCYLLIAADRMYAGLGPTAPLPAAPFQPWTWRADWVFLTHWPIGYPLLMCALRWTLGVGTLEACRWISAASCAAALTGWYTWVRRTVPRGVTGMLLAMLAAGYAVSTAFLVNPSTDALLVGLLPFVLLMVSNAGDDRGDSHAASRLSLTGLAAGALFWIRYAAVFVPLGIGLYLLVGYRRRRYALLPIGVYGVCAALPITALLAVNRVFGEEGPVQTQLNLGHAVGWDFTAEHFATAWWNFTDLGFYDYHWYSHWVYALWPAVGICVPIVSRSARKSLREFLAVPAVTLSAVLVLVLLGTLIGVTTVFSGKFDFVRLERYYAPVRPLYFVLFVAPLVLVPRRGVRIGLCVAMLLACSWIVQQEWLRPYKRWQAAGREATPYGQRSPCFEPGAGELYRWLSDQRADNLILVSNFHDYIALETKMSALPVPEDADTLNEWVNRICAARGVTNPRILFVLDADNHWREYYLRPAAEVIRTFGLKRRADAPLSVSAEVYEYEAGGGHGIPGA